MKRVTLVALSFAFAASIYLIFKYWTETQPVSIIDLTLDERTLNGLPERNRSIVNFVESNGTQMAPVYEETVCTEFVIKVIDQFSPLSINEKRQVHIITEENLYDLIRNESSIIKGVQTALHATGKGTIISNVADVKPGDFVQFWNVFNGKCHGHCGIVLDIDPGKTLSLFSSHSMTNGYGKQKYIWPDKVYFVRLK